MLARRGRGEKEVLPRASGISEIFRHGTARVPEIHERLLLARW